MKISVSILVLLFTISVYSQNNTQRYNENNYPYVISSKQINANNIRAWITNYGELHRDSVTTGQGFEWPKYSNHYAIYASGLWLGGKIQDSIHMAASHFLNEFLPGYVNINTQQPNGKDDPLYRIYKVSPLYSNGNSEFDNWSLWPVNQGAPWIDMNNNGIFEPPSDRPVMKGDQNMFCAFTDGYPEAHTLFDTGPLKADIHLYSWAKNAPFCTDVIYHEYKIINKRNGNWDSLFVGFFSDSDIGSNAGADRNGCDTMRNFMFNYKGVNNDPQYGDAPPAVGYLIYEASRHNGRLMDICNNYLKGFEHPSNYMMAFNLLKGLKRDGEPRINPYNNTVTRYTYSGNPEDSTGWVFGFPRDTRNLMSSYIGTVVPLDTIVFSVAVFIKRGTNNLNAVTQLKNCASQIIGITQNNYEIPEAYNLYQNYPNPFNPSTIISFEVPQLSNVKLSVYDILGREVEILVNSKLNAGTYNADWNAAGFSSGVYFYVLNTDKYKETRKMVLLK
jgi:hypothetical protein